MAVKMRLRRMGSRNAPFYRVVIQDGRRAPTGRFIETIGWYDPKQEGTNFSINLIESNIGPLVVHNLQIQWQV